MTGELDVVELSTKEILGTEEYITSGFQRSSMLSSAWVSGIWVTENGIVGT